MRQGRHGIKVLGLALLAALGLMAFAVSAQAGEYRIEGKTLTEKGIASEVVSATVAGGKLLVPALALTIKCTGGTATGSILLGGIAHASILFFGCEAEGSNGICKPYETKALMEANQAGSRGNIAASGLGELVLMGGKHYLLVSSTEFATIYWPKLCFLTLENKVSGSTVFYLPNALTMLKEQTASTIPQVELESLFPNDTLTYGGCLAWLDEGGTTNAALTGVNNGHAWGGE